MSFTSLATFGLAEDIAPEQPEDEPGELSSYLPSYTDKPRIDKKIIAYYDENRKAYVRNRTTDNHYGWIITFSTQELDVLKKHSTEEYSAFDVDGDAFVILRADAINANRGDMIFCFNKDTKMFEDFFTVDQVLLVPKEHLQDKVWLSWLGMSSDQVARITSNKYTPIPVAQLRRPTCETYTRPVEPTPATEPTKRETCIGNQFDRRYAYLADGKKRMIIKGSILDKIKVRKV